MASDAEDVERFTELPDPDRLFLQIEPAEVEMRVHDHDDAQETGGVSA